MGEGGEGWRGKGAEDADRWSELPKERGGGGGGGFMWELRDSDGDVGGICDGRGYYTFYYSGVLGNCSLFHLGFVKTRGKGVGVGSLGSN